jgi:hypothetical protein
MSPEQVPSPALTIDSDRIKQLILLAFLSRAHVWEAKGKLTDGSA